MKFKLIRLYAKLKTMLIFDREERRYKRNQIINSMNTKYIFGRNVIRTAKSIGDDFYCGGYSKVNKNTILSNKVCFNGMQIHGNGNVFIGQHFHSGVECLIITQNHNYDKADAIPYDDRYIYKDVVIDDFVWIGSRVMILPGTHIGEGAIIQGGSVVHGEIPPYAIAGGNPAKVFKYRDVEHFKKLKKERKFLTDEYKWNLQKSRYSNQTLAGVERTREGE